MKFIVHSNIWISLGAVALMFVTDLLGNSEFSSPHLYSIAFFATLLTYNWQRMLSVKKRQQKQAVSNLSSWVGGNLVSGYLASAAAAVICVYNFFHLHANQQSALVILALVSVLYALPIIPTLRGLIRLRDFGFTKPFVLGITWGLVTAWLPLIEPADSYTSFTLAQPANTLFVLASCLNLIALCIPFDVKDVAFDSATMAYPTLPVRFGVSNTIVLALAFSISGFILFAIWALFEAWGWPLIVAAFISLLIECWFINKTKADSKEWHYIFVLDGLLLVHAALLVGGCWVSIWLHIANKSGAISMI